MPTIDNIRLSAIIGAVASAASLEEAGKAAEAAIKENFFTRLIALLVPSYGVKLNQMHSQVRALVDVLYQARTEFPKQLAGLKPDSECLAWDLGTIIGEHMKALEDCAASFPNTAFCFGLDGSAGNRRLVLHVMDDEGAIRSVPLSDEPLPAEMAHGLALRLPRYWVGNPVGRATASTSLEGLREGAIEANVEQFFKDIRRMKILGDAPLASGADAHLPEWLPGKWLPPAAPDEAREQVVSVLSRLERFAPGCTDQQKLTFLQLSSQNAIPGRGGLGSNPPLLLLRGKACAVNARKCDKSLHVEATSRLDIVTTDNDEIKEIGTLCWSTEFKVQPDGTATCHDCTSMHMLYHHVPQQSLSAPLRFALLDLGEDLQQIREAFTKGACVKINDALQPQSQSPGRFLAIFV